MEQSKMHLSGENYSLCGYKKMQACDKRKQNERECVREKKGRDSRWRDRDGDRM